MNFTHDDIPDWENTGTEPSSTLQENGFTAGYKPPASVFNWFWSKIIKAITEIQTKLSGVEDNANNYELPAATPEALGGVKIATPLQISSQGVLSVKNATTSEAGLMQTSDKTKLDAIEAGASKPFIVTADIDWTIDGYTVSNFSKTVAEVNAAYRQGKQIILVREVTGSSFDIYYVSSVTSSTVSYFNRDDSYIHFVQQSAYPYYKTFKLPTADANAVYFDKEIYSNYLSLPNMVRSVKFTNITLAAGASKTYNTSEAFNATDYTVLRVRDGTTGGVTCMSYSGSAFTYSSTSNGFTVAFKSNMTIVITNTSGSAITGKSVEFLIFKTNPLEMTEA